MQRRLGLDMGTNSIGWCLTEGPGDAADRIVDIGVRIFSDGRDPQSGTSLAVDRRDARSARRRRDRYIGRRSAFLDALIAHGLMPADADEFREFLLDQGFEMSQFSVYARFCNGRESYDSHLKRIEQNLPEKGEIHVLTFTDKQYENIVRFSSQRRKRPRKNPDQLALF